MSKIAILATDGFEQSELFEPLKALKDADHETTIVSLKKGSIKAWNKDDWGKTIEVEMLVKDADAEDFDGLLLPGGVMNPDHLRAEKDAVAFVKGFASKPIAAICHGPWTLIDAGLVDGHKMTSWPSLKMDLTNAGAEWVDEKVVVDGNLITSRKPDDLPAFNEKFLEALTKPAMAKKTGKETSARLQ